MWREVTTWEAGRSIRRRRWEKSQIGSNRIGEHRIGTHQLTRSRASWAPLPASRDDCASPRWHTWVGRAGDRESSLRSPPWSHQSPSRFAAPAAPSSPLRYTTLKINFSGVYSSLILANGVPLLEFISIQRLSGTDYWHIKLILILQYTHTRLHVHESNEYKCLKCMSRFNLVCVKSEKFMASNIIDSFECF